MNQGWISKTLLDNEVVTDMVVISTAIIYYVNHRGLWFFAKNSSKQYKPELVIQGNFNGITWDKSDNIYVFDSSKVIQYSLESCSVGFVWTINCAWSIAVDTINNILCVGEGGSLIHKINLKKKKRVSHGSRINFNFDGASKMTFVNGIFLISEHRTHGIKMLKEGFVDLLAGGTESNYEDGTVSDAKFAYPTHLTVDREGAILVADNCALRRIDLNNQVVSSLFSPNGCKLQCVATDERGFVYVGTTKGISIVQTSWKWERYLWIAKLKEHQSYCPLAGLPTEVLKELALMVRNKTIPQAPFCTHKRKRME